MKEDELIKIAFGKAMEELGVPKSLEDRVLWRRKKPFSWAVPLGSLVAGILLGAILIHLWHTKEEYILMGEGKVEGVHVVFEKDVKIGQVEDFLRARGLSMIGPTQAGTFFIKNAKGEHIEELRRLNYIKEVFK